jgi:hypothetical protein
MRRRWHAFVALMDRREPATPLALARFLVGAVLAADLLTIARLEIVTALFTAPADEGMAYAAETSFLWRALGGGADAAWTIWTICVVSAVFFSAGLFSRVWALVLAVAYAELARLLPEADRGIDGLLRIALVLFALSAADETLSLAAWLRHRRFVRSEALAPAWPRYVLIGQLVWLYFSAGTNKLQSPWTPVGGFSALHYVLLDPHFARYDLSFVTHLHPLTRLATFLTMAFEWLAPLLLLGYYYRATPERPGRLRALANRLRLWQVWIALGITFHVSLAIFLRLGIFPFGALALYPVFFHHDELMKGWARVSARFTRREPAT